MHFAVSNCLVFIELCSWICLHSYNSCNNEFHLNKITLINNILVQAKLHIFYYLLLFSKKFILLMPESKFIQYLVITESIPMLAQKRNRADFVDPPDILHNTSSNDFAPIFSTCLISKPKKSRVRVQIFLVMLRCNVFVSFESKGDSSILDDQLKI